MTSATKDFLNWPAPQWLEYTEGTTNEHLYTNGITPYHRAPHIFIGFPKRVRPDRDLKVHHYPGVSDGVFMTSRDGLLFNRWREAFLRPGPDKTRWVNRNNMIAWGVMQTSSGDPNLPGELSIYATEGYYVGPCELRRHTIRLDGFVSINAPATGGTFATKVLIFADGEDPPLPQPGQSAGQLTFTTESPIRGTQSIEFTSPGVITLPDTQNLGAQATFAVHVRNVPGGHRRLFSAYDGGGIDVMQNELIFDCNPSGQIGGSETGFRFYYDTKVVEAPAGALPQWADDGNVHHLAATYDDGVMRLYLDGKEVASAGEQGLDPTKRHGDLVSCEDYPHIADQRTVFLASPTTYSCPARAFKPRNPLLPPKAPRPSSEKPPLKRASLTAEDDKAGNSPTRSPAPRRRAPARGRPKPSSSSTTPLPPAQHLVRDSDADGNPIPGFSMEDCDEIYGDHIERVVTWGGKSELKDLIGTPIRLKFKMSDADLYALRFR